jgi:hypothetical protein
MDALDVLQHRVGEPPMGVADPTLVPTMAALTGSGRGLSTVVEGKASTAQIASNAALG